MKPQQIPVHSRSISPKTPMKDTRSPRGQNGENLTQTPGTADGKVGNKKILQIYQQFGSQKPPERVLGRLGSADKVESGSLIQKKNLRQILNNKESSMSPSRSQAEMEEDISEQAQHPINSQWGSTVHHQIMKLSYNRSKNDNILQKDKNQSVSLQKLERLANKVDRSEQEKPQKPHRIERRHMNQTMNKLQLNSLLSQLPEVIQEDVAKTQRNREGELSSHSSPHLEDQDSSSVESNCTEERNFTPGQNQFKKFLKEQTADEKTLKM